MKIIYGAIMASFLLFSSVFTRAESKGYVSFDDLTSSYGEPKVEINLGAAMMGFVGTMSKNEDPALAEMLSKLESVRVLVYNTRGDGSSALAAVDKVSKKIKKDKWRPIVSVNEEKEKVRVYAKYTDKIMDGLVVMVVDSPERAQGEVVFINIVGEIDPNNVQKVTESLNIDLGGRK